MRLEAALLASLFVTRGVCSVQEDASRVIHRRHADYHHRMRRDAEQALHGHEKRKDDVFGVPGGVWPTVVVPPGYTLAAGVEITPIPGMSTIPVATPAATASAGTIVGNVDPALWDKQVEQACINAVMNMKGKTTNDAGLAICYNVPYLDQNNGTFEADLRLYNISAPTARWAGISSTDMSIKILYPNGSISKTDGRQLPVKRQVATQTVAAQTTGAAALAGQQGEMPNGIMMPIEIAVRKYIGQVNANLMTPKLNLTTLQPLLIPQISILSTDPKTKQQINTSLSLTEASFVAGIFSKAPDPITDPKLLSSRPADQIAAAQAGKPTPFVMPGVSLEVAPVGLVITCTWTLVFLTVVFIGTLGRVRCRDQYRKAVQAEKEETEAVRRF